MIDNPATPEIRERIFERLEEIKQGGYKLKARKALSNGWKVFLDNAGGFIFHFLMALIPAIIGNIVAQNDPWTTEGSVGPEAAWIMIGCLVVSVLLISLFGYPGIGIVGRKIARGIPYSYNELFAGLRKHQSANIGIAFVMGITYLLISFVTTIALVLVLNRDEPLFFPGFSVLNTVVISAIVVLFTGAFSLVMGYGLFLVNIYGVPAGKAVSAGFTIAARNKAFTVKFIALQFALTLAGAVTCGLGLLAALPLIVCASWAALDTILGPVEIPDSLEAPLEANEEEERL